MKNNEALDKMFAEHAMAFSDLDFEKQSENFADAFIMAGPNGATAQSLEAFKRTAPQAVEFYRSVGQKKAEILSIEQSTISDDYAMVKVHWGVYFEKMGDVPVEFDISYVVQTNLPDPKIILAITHQDEDEAMKKLQAS